MLAKRIIPCLDIKDGQVVKGVHFKDLKTVGNAVECARMYEQEGADELVFLDITATVEKRKTLLHLVTEVGKAIHIPFTVGGGISTIEDVRTMLLAGADKVCICSAAVKNPDFIGEIAQEFGSQAVVISIDAKRVSNDVEKWTTYIKGGREDTGIDAIEFAKQMESQGAGELLINSLDRDGTKLGYDIPLLQKISHEVYVPVVASSGAGSLQHFLETFTETKADAALAASLFHFREIEIHHLKLFLRNHGIEVRI